MERQFNRLKLINEIPHINTGKNPHDHLSWCRKSIHKMPIHKNIQVRKKLRKLEIEGNLFNRIKARDEPTAVIILGVERLKAFT